MKEAGRRAKGQIGVVEHSPDVLNDAPVIAGTRVPTAAIKAFHDDGYNFAGIISEYPDLTVADIEAALAFEGQNSQIAKFNNLTLGINAERANELIKEIGKVRCWLTGFHAARHENSLMGGIAGEDSLRQMQLLLKDAIAKRGK